MLLRRTEARTGRASGPGYRGGDIVMWVRIWPHLALLLAMVFWSTSYVALRIALSALDPFTVMAGRMGVATLLFLPLWGGLLRDLRRKGQWRWLLLMAFAEPCCYFLLETRALCLTTASQAGMIISLLPLITAVVAWRLLGERVSLRGWIGFALAVAGVVWLSLQSAVDETATAPVLGNFFEGLAMVCAALYTVLALASFRRLFALADHGRAVLRGHELFCRAAGAGRPWTTRPCCCMWKCRTGPPGPVWSIWAGWSRWGATACTTWGSAVFPPPVPPPTPTLSLS